ncbi:hypothetical protein ZPAH1_orf00012 [Aeromonas phage ZPAH1]|nr:hypothetical protein ZPAH1_orf00012 [Aeromonas phage ZPAH1]
MTTIYSAVIIFSFFMIIPFIMKMGESRFPNDLFASTLIMIFTIAYVGLGAFYASVNGDDPKVLSVMLMMNIFCYIISKIISKKSKK